MGRLADDLLALAGIGLIVAGGYTAWQKGLLCDLGPEFCPQRGSGGGGGAGTGTGGAPPSSPSVNVPGPSGGGDEIQIVGQTCTQEQLNAAAERWVRGEMSDSEFQALLASCDTIEGAGTSAPSPTGGAIGGNKATPIGSATELKGADLKTLKRMVSGLPVVELDPSLLSRSITAAPAQTLHVPWSHIGFLDPGGSCITADFLEGALGPGFAKVSGLNRYCFTADRTIEDRSSGIALQFWSQRRVTAYASAPGYNSVTIARAGQFIPPASEWGKSYAVSFFVIYDPFGNPWQPPPGSYGHLSAGTARPVGGLGGKGLWFPGEHIVFVLICHITEGDITKAEYKGNFQFLTPTPNVVPEANSFFTGEETNLCAWYAIRLRVPGTYQISPTWNAFEILCARKGPQPVPDLVAPMVGGYIPIRDAQSGAPLYYDGSQWRIVEGFDDPIAVMELIDDEQGNLIERRQTQIPVRQLLECMQTQYSSF